MCLEDIRLGRKKISAPKTVAVAGAPGNIVIGTNEARVALIISNDSASQVLHGPKGMDLSATQGLALTSNHPIEVMRIEDWGNAICGEWFALSVAGPSNVSIVEVLLQDK
jgi:hypothetical protein